MLLESGLAGWWSTSGTDVAAGRGGTGTCCTGPGAGRAWIERADNETFAIPGLGLRYLRNTTKLRIRVNGEFLTAAGKLPAPIRALFEALPAESYARTTLAKLEGLFNPQTLPALETVIIAETDADADAYASVDTTEP